MCRTWGMHFFTMYDTYHPADFAAEGRLCSKYLPKSKSILDVKHYAVCGLFCIQILSEKYDAFIFFHTISVIINRLTLQPKGEGC